MSPTPRQSNPAPSEALLPELERELENQLARKGEIFVTKDTGLFLAIK